MDERRANKAEEFVLAVSRRSFLSLWCEKNPQGKDPSKELCDILVVCDPHVIIVSVKEVHYQSDKDPAVASKRWEREAIKASVRQIYGAERWLSRANRVVRKDGSLGLWLPGMESRQVHRIAVAFGGNGEVPVTSRNFGNGYVHVLTDRGFEDVLSELDTITDLVGFLAAKERSMGAGGTTRIVVGPESNLLAYYLLNGKKFPTGFNVLLIDDTLWPGLMERDEYKRKKEADSISYDWDRLIDHYIGPSRELASEPDEQFTGMEIALRAMAREDRLSRRVLARAMRDFVEQAVNAQIRSRTIWGESGVIYVLTFFRSTGDRERRVAVLRDQVFLARHTIGTGTTVIGIGFTERDPGTVALCELVSLDATKWKAEDDARAERLKAERGDEAPLALRNVTEDEYPAAPAAPRI